MLKLTARQITKKVLATLATVLTIAAGGILVSGSPAQAATWACPTRNSAGVPIAGCIYPDVDGHGTPYLAGFNQGCHNLTGGGWDNVASSIRNNPGHGYLLEIWADGGCTGHTWSVVPGGQGNLGAGGGTEYPFLNDSVSSWAVFPPGTWG